MLFFALSTVALHRLNLLRNVAFVVLDCGVLLALVTFFKGSKPALPWLIAVVVVSTTLFAVSFSHLKHQMLAVAPPASSSAPIGATLARTVQESGDAVMKACLVVSGIFIVLQGLRLVVLFAGARVPNGPDTIQRFFLGALLCVGILGAGLSVRWAPTSVRESSTGETRTLTKG